MRRIQVGPVPEICQECPVISDPFVPCPLGKKTAGKVEPINEDPWVPIAERLPEEEMLCEITGPNGIFYKARYQPRYWGPDHPWNLQDYPCENYRLGGVFCRDVVKVIHWRDAHEEKWWLKEERS